MQTKAIQETPTRLMTLDELRSTVLPLFLTPIPCSATLRRWFNVAKIPRLKSNPCAMRGGGPVRYSVAHVENYFKKHARVSK